MSRPVDLAPVDQLGAKRPHGHKMRYMAGCRCAKCRRGNAEYKRKMNEDRKKFGPNDLVPADAVRAHVCWLRSFGMGPKTIGKVAGVAKTSLREILYDGRSHMRRRSANRVLAVQPTLDNLPRTAKVQASDTLHKIKQLVNWGVPQLVIARDALRNSNPLQIPALKGRTETVCVKTAIAIRDYFHRVQRMRSIWVALHGSIPLRHYVYWKPGCRGLTIRSFELRPFAVNYDYMYRYPRELKDVIRANNQLKRSYRAKRRSVRGEE